MFDVALVKKKILATNVNVKFHFLLAMNNKFVGFEKHCYYEYDSITKVENENTGRKKTSRTKASVIVIIHKNPMTVFFNVPQKWGSLAYDDLGIVEKCVSNEMQFQIPVPDTRHNDKVLITNKNIGVISKSIHKIMRSWRWDLINTYWQAGENMRKVHILGADGINMYSGGEYPSIFGIEEITNSWEEITEDKYKIV